MYFGEGTLKAVIQEETTGCGIAAVANILGKNYSEIKTIANAMGFFRKINGCGLIHSM